jgi:hypothetical protein
LLRCYRLIHRFKRLTFKLEEDTITFDLDFSAAITESEQVQDEDDEEPESSMSDDSENASDDDNALPE